MFGNTHINLHRLAVDYDYWDSVAPSGAEQYLPESHEYYAMFFRNNMKEVFVDTFENRAKQGPCNWEVNYPDANLNLAWLIERPNLDINPTKKYHTVQAFKTSDGELFEREIDAINHEEFIKEKGVDDATKSMD